MKQQTNTTLTNDKAVLQCHTALQIVMHDLPNPKTYQGLLYKDSFNGKQYIFEKVTYKNNYKWVLLAG